MSEEWDDVPGYTGLYRVSTFGNVLSLPDGTCRKNGTRRKLSDRTVAEVESLLLSGRSKKSLAREFDVDGNCIRKIALGTYIREPVEPYPLAKSTDGYGYLVVGLTDKYGKLDTRKVHRLVAATFIPNPECKPCVNHKDGNKKNNHVDNLEWATVKENSDHAIKNGLTSSVGSRNPNSKLVESQVLEIRKRVAAGEVQTHVARDYGISQVMVGAIVARHNWKHV